MKFSALSQSVAACLIGAVAAEWSITGYTGQICTGQRMYSMDSMGEYIPIQCREIEHANGITSITINIDGGSESPWEFELHHGDGCHDLDYGPLTFEPGNSGYCVKTLGATHVLARRR